MKDLIIGGCFNYNYDQIKFWINSINRSGFVGDKVLIVFDCDDTLASQIEQNNFKVVRLPFDPSMAPHVQRFIAIYDYIENNPARYVITTDVRDVIFQYDPMKWVQQNLIDSGKDLVAGSECLRYKDEPWGNQNLMDTYGQFIHDRFKDNVIYNVGVLAGRSNHIRDLCLNIVLNSINRPVKICDQAVFNLLIQNEIYKQSMVYANLADRWVANLGTLADPNKMAYFSPNLLELPPYFTGEKVVINNPYGPEVCVVHQYDRTPWKHAIETIYR